MIVAILLIKISPTREREIYEKLSNSPQVKDCHVLFGEYDLIAKVEAENFNALVDTVYEIEMIPGVIDVKAHLPPIRRPRAI